MRRYDYEAGGSSHDGALAELIKRTSVISLVLGCGSIVVASSSRSAVHDAQTRRRGRARSAEPPTARGAPMNAPPVARAHVHLLLG